MVDQRDLAAELPDGSRLTLEMPIDLRGRAADLTLTWRQRVQ